jgi:uncharacterized repeat protein (TIGR01451 family)
VVGNAETFTITVHALPGSTPGTTIAAPTVSFVGGSPVSVGPVTLMSNDGSTAVYTVTINNPTAGKFEIKASDNITFTSPYSPLPGSLTLTRATGDGHTGDSADAVKTYQDIAVSITPSATDVVGHQHTFTAHVGINLGDGAGFVNDPNATVTVALTPSNGASVHQDSPTNGVVGGGGAVTYTLTTDANGNATVTFDSPTAGKVTGHASSTLDLGAGGSVTRTTGDGYTTTGGSDSANAVKTYVDAYISITPSATNPINAPHTFTVSVFTNNGDGTGYHQVQDSTAVTETLTAAGGASITQLNPGSGTGLASATYNLTTTSAFSPGVTFTSPTVGTVTGHASTTITVLGVPLTRATNDGVSLDSPDAVKTFANPRIALVKLTNGTNNDGAPVAGTPDGPLVPFGSTVTWTYNVSNTGTEPIANVKVTDSVSGVTPATVFGDGAPGHGNATHNIGDANNNNLLDLTETWVFTASGAAVLGQYSNVGTATGTSTVTSTPVSATNPDHYFGVDAFISITPQQATNPVGTAHTFTITVTALPGTIALNAANVSFATPTITYPGLTPDLAHPATATFVSRTGNVATYSLTINSSQAGTFEVKASDTVTFSSASSPNTLPLTRTTGDGYTDANGSDSLDAFKTYTNGNIKLAGLTLGFWKNHTDQWKTTDSNGNVISIPVSIKLIDAFPDAANAAGGVYKTETLLTALQTGGGGLNALFRQAAAAYLNSQHPLVGYPISTADLQRVVYDAVKLNKFGTQIDDLQTLLNNLNGIEVGIDAHGNPTGGNPTLSKAQVNAQITAYNNKYYSPPSSGIPLLP